MKYSNEDLQMLADMFFKDLPPPAGRLAARAAIGLLGRLRRALHHEYRMYADASAHGVDTVQAPVLTEAQWHDRAAQAVGWALEAWRERAQGQDEEASC